MVHFLAGLRNFAAIPVPVWVEAKEAIGTLRARLQIIQEPPFVKVTLYESTDTERYIFTYGVTESGSLSCPNDEEFHECHGFTFYQSL
jgi:hypothetical protein